MVRLGKSSLCHRSLHAHMLQTDTGWLMMAMSSDDVNLNMPTPCSLMYECCCMKASGWTATIRASERHSQFFQHQIQQNCSNRRYLNKWFAHLTARPFLACTQAAIWPWDLEESLEDIPRPHQGRWTKDNPQCTIVMMMIMTIKE